MAGEQNKTVATDVDVGACIAALEPPRRREEAQQLLVLYARITGEPAKMWGPSIIGFGQYHYTYESGRSGTSCRSGFSPRKANHSIYLMCGSHDPVAATQQTALLARLGKHKMGKACLYITRLDKIDMSVLEELIGHDLAQINRLYPPV